MVLENKRTNATNITAAVNDLRAIGRGTLVVRGQDAYSRTRAVWNAAVDNQPDAFMFCETVEDVQNSVRIARKHNVPLSVRGHGFDWTGRSIRNGGLVIDLSLMDRIDVDTSTKVATVAAGATASDVLAAANPYGLVAVTGSVGQVGMTGLTLGGGYGPLNSKYGLALDNLLGAEVVLADGTRVTADEFTNADLFWALRGGGGNFGIVTSLRLRLHSHGKIAGGAVIYPWEQVEDTLIRLGSVVALAPDELTVDVAIVTGPAGGPILLLLPCWIGEFAKSESVFSELQQLGTPIMAHLGPTTCAEMVSGNNEYVTHGQWNELRSRLLPDLTPDIVREIVLAGDTRTSPLSHIILHDFHGAGTRVAPDSTAFAPRQKHFMMQIISSWLPGNNDNGYAHKRWAELTSTRLKPFALPGGYPSILGPDDHAQIAESYGTNGERLRKVKKQFDPDGVFNSAISLP
jgi:FAD/FMN-containing dehydrogenase